MMNEAQVKHHLHEELHDIQEYIAMYHESDEGMFKDIAMEEMTHAQILKDIIDAHGWNTADIIAEWNQSIEMMK